MNNDAVRLKIKSDAKRVFSYLEQLPHFPVYTFGNGGSATIADHMATDWAKSSGFKLNIRSLSSNNSMLSMIANDYGYDEVCAKQLEPLPNKGIIILISSSGTSANILRAARYATAVKGLHVLGFTGLCGTKKRRNTLRDLAFAAVVCKSSDYGTVEDYHSAVMHEVARLLRQKRHN